MNNIYRVVWSACQQCWVVVSELTKSKGKTKNSVKKKALLIVSLGAGLFTASAGAVDYGDIEGPFTFVDGDTANTVTSNSSSEAITSIGSLTTGVLNVNNGGSFTNDGTLTLNNNGYIMSDGAASIISLKNLNVDSTGDWMYGVYSANRSTTTLSGDAVIHTSGASASGIRMNLGGKITIDGNLDVNAENAEGINVSSANSTATVKGHTTIKAGGYGIQANNGIVNLADADITSGSVGINAQNGAAVTVTGNLVINSAGNGIVTNNMSGGTVNVNTASVTTTGNNAVGIYATGFKHTGAVSIKTSGSGAHGMVFNSPYGSSNNTNLNNISITTTGDNANALSFSPSGTSTGVVNTIGWVLDSSVDNLSGLKVTGNDSSLVYVSSPAWRQNISVTLQNQTFDMRQVGTGSWGITVDATSNAAPASVILAGTTSTGGTGLRVNSSNNGWSSLTLTDSATAEGSRVAVNAGTLNLNRTDNTASLGSLEGAGSVRFGAVNGALTLGQNNVTNNGSLVDNADFSGSLTNVGSLTKTGALTQILSGINTVGSVNVQQGTLQFGQAGNFTTTGDYTTAGGATTDTGRNGSVLKVTGNLVQSAGATLVASVNAGTPAIVAKTAHLDGTLTLNGFSFSKNGAPAKASAVSGSNYVLIHTTDGITGNFTNDISQSTDIDYLVQNGGINGNDYTVGFQTAWDNGGQSRGTGSFTLGSGTTFEYDTVLADQAGTFASGWNGKSLTKAGDGTLILSAANTYSGMTTLNAGTLQLKGAGTLGLASGTTTMTGGVLDLGTTTQTQATLNQSGGTLQNGTLNAGTYQMSGGTLAANGIVNATTYDLQAGTIAGVLNGGGVLNKSTAGLVTVTGTGSTVGSVDVQGGTLSLGQTGAFTTTGNYTTESGATTALASKAASLAVGGAFTQAKDSALNITLSEKPSTPQITAKTASLDGTLSTTLNTATQPVTSSAVGSLYYTLIHTTDGITGDFTNSRAIKTDLDYLLLDGHRSADNRDYLFGYRMAWTDGGQTLGGGTFTLASGKTFTVDTTLADQSGTFDSGWDGTSLTKNGEGKLVLSAANTYSGGTTLNAGTLALSGDGTLGASTGTTTVTGGILDLGSTTQTQAILNQSGGTLQNGTLNAGTYRLTGGTLAANGIVNAATYDLQAGTVAGVLNGTGALVKSTDGVVSMTGAGSTVSSVEVQGGTLSFGQSGAFTTTGDYKNTGGITDVGTNGSTLAVGGVFSQTKDGTLNVALDGTNPVIVADSAVLDGRVVFSGFSDIAQPVKASEITATDYLLMHTANGITGDLAVSSAIDTPDYLNGTGHMSADGKDYSLRALSMAWTDGGQKTGTGTFTVNEGTAFDADVVLADRSGIFDSGWDGKSLTKAGAGLLVLSAANTYTGSTVVNAGTLRTDLDNNLVNSSRVVVNGGTLDLNGHRQVVNSLSGSGGQVVLNGAELTVNNTTATDRTAFAGNIMDGSASGGLTKTGDGVLTLTGKTGWTGTTQLKGGELILDGSQGGAQLVSNIVGVSGTRLTLQNGASLTGWIDPTDVNVGKGSIWNMTADSLVDDLTLAGKVAFSAPGKEGPGRTLTVKNLIGNGGTVSLYTTLGDDSSATDKIVIDGGKASGDTGLQIRHGDEPGAQTVKGIRVVETRNGATTSTDAFHLSSASDGYRAGKDTIASGAYDYSLVRGGNGGNADDWYLTSELSYRPETGVYLNNKLAASTIQNHTLHDRLDAGHDQDIWIRMSAGADERTGAGGQDLSGHSLRVHMGADLLNITDGRNGQILAGVMGQYSAYDNESEGRGLKADGSVSGYSLGLYGTWFARQDRTGLYADTWVMSGKFDNKVSGEGLTPEYYDSTNTSVSLETGYAFPVYDGDKGILTLEPQAQVIYSDYRADRHTEHNGTVVSGQSDDSVTTRLGLRANGDIKSEDHPGMSVYTEANWWHGPDSQSITFDGETVHDRLPADRLEVKVGMKGQVSKSVSLWGAVSGEAGSEDYLAGKAEIGVKYTW